MKQIFLVAIVATILLTIGCGTERPQEPTVPDNMPVVTKNCGCTKGSPKESAIIFDSTHTDFRIDSTKIIMDGNHCFLPLNLSTNNADYNQIFVNEHPEIILKILSKLEKQQGRKIKGWKYDDMVPYTREIYRYSLVSMYIDFEDSPINSTHAESTSVNTQTGTEIEYPVVVRKGFTAYETFHMKDSATLLSFTNKYHLKYWYNSSKELQILIHEGDTFMLTCRPKGLH